jgi:hypothetical protein
MWTEGINTKYTCLGMQGEGVDTTYTCLEMQGEGVDTTYTCLEMWTVQQPTPPPDLHFISDIPL